MHLCRIQQWQLLLLQQQQQPAPHEEVNEIANDPQLHHYIGQSEKIYDDFGYYLHSHAKDPTMKVINS
jgi:hypothetical protein